MKNHMLAIRAGLTGDTTVLRLREEYQERLSAMQQLTKPKERKAPASPGIIRLVFARFGLGG